MKTKSEILHTPRLTLKSLSEPDRQQMVSILCDETVKKTYMIPDFADPRQAEALFEKMMRLSQSSERFLYGGYHNDLLIGFVNDCEVKDLTMELGYVIAPAYQGKGFATEAVKACIGELFAMGFARVKAGFFEENIPSCRVMQKCGMHKIDFEEDIEYKGILRHCIYYVIENSLS